MSALRKWFFSGLLVVLPLAVTVWVLQWIIGTLDQTLLILPAAWHPDRILGLHIPGLGVLLALAVLLLVGAIASNSATTAEVGFAAAHACGRPYYLEPRIDLQPAMNFDVSLRWPGLVAMPSTFNARVGVILDGYLMRASQ